ncbi:Glu/Leu/Phe/Val dehydrogenase dimerization domain-containing protein [Cryptosporangium japonicum]|uniref:Glu/Leu/Phe/Val dehydrogenase n=1 Tax=Cryptosporangium japonicum TaxID=80872 RepID=A0ABN0TV81_9ACTN
MFTHEELHVRAGRRTGLPIVVAVHSTVLGQALGGCRLWHYDDWRDGVEDALRLSAAMTAKNALAGLANGGGKTVVPLPPGVNVDADTRRALLHDVGDTIEALDGRYGTGPDVGTGPDDMVVIGERTPHVFCRPAAHGGSGSSSPGTAAGVIAALRATVARLDGDTELGGHTFAVVGLGSVGADVAGRLAAAGARLVVSDVRPDAETLAAELGARWSRPGDALTAEVDVVIPAALGGILTAELVPALRCRAVVGPANNQLAEPAVAGLLHERGILWAPDYVASAGGIVHAVASELYREPEDVVARRIERIGDTLTEIYAAGEAPDVTAEKLVAARLTPGTR